MDACGVCGDEASSYKLYGSVCLVCLSCKTFFRRMVKVVTNKAFLERKSSHQGPCLINKWTRKRCRICRYEKCLNVGMDPHLVDSCKKNDETGSELSPAVISVIRHTGPFIQSERTFKAKASISKELGVYIESSTTDWFYQHLKNIHEKTCKDTFSKAEYRMTLSHNIVSIFRQSITETKIVGWEEMSEMFESYTNEVASKFARFVLQNISENSIHKLVQDHGYGYFGLMAGLEHSFRHRPLLEQASYSYQCPIDVQFLRKNVPQIESLKGIPLDKHETLTSPWANTIEDEEYVTNTNDKFEELIDDDSELAKMITFLVLFSPLEMTLSPGETAELKKYQSKVTMIIYNHLLHIPEYDNLKALDRLSKIGYIIDRLKKSAEILKMKSISMKGLDFQVDHQDFSSIDLCQW